MKEIKKSKMYFHHTTSKVSVFGTHYLQRKWQFLDLDRENQLEIGKISWGSGKSAGVFLGLCAVTRSLASSASDTVMHVFSLFGGVWNQLLLLISFEV